MGDTESCITTATSSPRKRVQKFDVCEEISKKLRASENEEASQPGFENELWNHFNRFSISYATDVNVEQPEDVIMHMKLLHLAEESNTRPAFEVRIVQFLNSFTFSSCPTYAFGLSPSLELALKAKGSNSQGGANSERFFIHDPVTVKLSERCRYFYEITISTVDKPKLLSKLTSLFSEIGLNIQEAHAFSTADGYSLDTFVVDGWSFEIRLPEVGCVESQIAFAVVRIGLLYWPLPGLGVAYDARTRPIWGSGRSTSSLEEKTEQLIRDVLEREIPKIQIEDSNTGNERIASRLKIKQAAKALQEAQVLVQLLEKEHALAIQEDLAIANEATSSLQ
ncbi:hypothetical protein RHSIM_Rhsim06G0011200 [Rhododendron simsii]|uniref:ACT domain-containing protein n=1 Tax=Rhododendron simsii TaxID=118357 RepID=A0A834GUP4_RHOSS|nr:hypothetical protein RHSIM_Rhsim06G0011200 [Rhododendron simsii]